MAALGGEIHRAHWKHECLGHGSISSQEAKFVIGVKLIQRDALPAWLIIIIPASEPAVRTLRLIIFSPKQS